MMFRRATASGLLLLLLFASMSFKCGGRNEPDARREATLALGDLDRIVGEMLMKQQTLTQPGQLTLDERRRLAQPLFAVKEYTNVIRNTLNSTTELKSTDKVALARLFSDLKTSLQVLNNNGIKPIQNPTIRLAFQSDLQRTQAPLAILSALARECEDLGGACFRCQPDPCIYCPNIPPRCPPQPSGKESRGER